MPLGRGGQRSPRARPRGNAAVKPVAASRPQRRRPASHARGQRIQIGGFDHVHAFPRVGQRLLCAGRVGRDQRQKRLRLGQAMPPIQGMLRTRQPGFHADPKRRIRP